MFGGARGPRVMAGSVELLVLALEIKINLSHVHETVQGTDIDGLASNRLAISTSQYARIRGSGINNVHPS